jgi:hypothetical protein
VVQDPDTGNFQLTGKRGDYIVDGASLLNGEYAHRRVSLPAEANLDTLDTLLASDPVAQTAVEQLNDALSDPKVDVDKVTQKFWGIIDRRATALGRSADGTTHGFWGSRNALGETTMNWTNIMGAGALALALAQPFERRYESRRAEKRADKQWEKERAWEERQMELANQYRLEQIGAMGAAGAASAPARGTPSGVQVARF